MRLKILQVGEQVLRQKARPLTAEEICSPSTQQLIEMMRETMRDAPGVGLAAPQVGMPLQLAVIEDQAEYMKGMSPEEIKERERAPVRFQVIINPSIAIVENTAAEFFEGCLSVAGFSALVPRARTVRVRCLNERGEPIEINARGWYARILQHEIDHLHGRLYTDLMDPRTFMTTTNYARYWKDQAIAAVHAALK